MTKEPRIDDTWKQQREQTNADRNLAAGVLIQSFFDLHASNIEVRREAELFLFSRHETHATVRRYWLRAAGLKVNTLDNIKRLSIEQLRQRLADQPRWRQQRRARYSERTRQAAA